VSEASRSLEYIFWKGKLDLHNISENNERYRWYILTIAAFTHAICAAMPVMCLPVLFKEISDDLGLTLIQIGLIWGISGLPVLVTGLMGGGIGDRFGARLTLIVFCILAGVTGALRGLSNSFLTLSITMIVFSFITPIIQMNVIKTCSIWFSKGMLGLANGVTSMGMALGFLLGTMLSATVFSPLLGGWRNVLFLYGVFSVLIGLIWLLTKPAPGDITSQTGKVANQSIWANLLHVGKLRNVWLLGFFFLGIRGCIQGVLGYLPLYLREIGWTGTYADNATGSFHIASMIFVLPIAYWSDKVDSRKKLLMIIVPFIILGVTLVPFVNGVLIWTMIIMAGIVRDGSMAIFVTLLIESDGVGRAYAGTASGLVLSISAIGMLFAPPLGNSLAEINSPGFPFLFWAALAVGGWLALSFVRENAGRNIS